MRWEHFWCCDAALSCGWGQMGWSRLLVTGTLQGELRGMHALLLSKQQNSNVALKKALEIAIPEIHNSDQGSQFTAEEYLAILKYYETIRISMDGRGRAMDNIFTERLWRTIKQEEVYLREYQSPREARQSLREYLTFYNHERKHQSLQYETPETIYFKRR